MNPKKEKKETQGTRLTCSADAGPEFGLINRAGGAGRGVGTGTRVGWRVRFRGCNLEVSIVVSSFWGGGCCLSIGTGFFFGVSVEGVYCGIDAIVW